MKVDKVDNIKDFPGYYISREGFLYSRYDKVGRLTDTYKRNKTYVRSNGYVQVVLKIRKENRLRRVYIHRLVAETYIPNPDNKPCVGHKDNNRENNTVENLYWCTHKENTKQCIDDGRFNIPSQKLNDESINSMIEDYESGMSNIQIKAKYKISIMTMYKYFNERGVIWKKVKR